MTSSIRKAPWSRKLARGLAVCFTVSLAAPMARAQQVVPPAVAAKADVLILPIAKPDTIKVPPAIFPDVASTAEQSISSGLDASGRFASSVFVASSPAVRRAVREQRLTEADVASLNVSPVSDATIDKVADDLGFTQGIVISGDLAGYTYDPTAGKVEITLSLTVQNRGAESTPKVVAVTGDSKPVAGGADEHPLAIEAAQDAGQKAAAAILQQLSTATIITTPPPTGTVALPPPIKQSKHRGRVLTGVLAVLGVVAVALLLSHGHSSSPGTGGGGTTPGGGGTTPGGGEQPPPPPPF